MRHISIRNRLVLLISLCTTSGLAASNSGYDTEERLFKNAVFPGLISAGLCNSAADCGRKDYVKFSVQGTTLSISVYKIKSIDIASDVVRRVLLDVAENKDKPMPRIVDIHIYQKEFNPSVFVWSKKPMIELILSGE